MQKLLKKIALCSSLFVLFGCGFSPMYSGADLSAETREIYVAPISGTNGVDMRNGLRAKFGTDNEKFAKYILTVNLAPPYTIYKAIQKTGDATWQEVRLTANYKLTDGTTNTVITSGADMASESYTFVLDLVAGQASYNNAVQSAIRILSEKIETHIAAKLAN